MLVSSGKSTAQPDRFINCEENLPDVRLAMKLILELPYPIPQWLLSCEEVGVEPGPELLSQLKFLIFTEPVL